LACIAAALGIWRTDAVMHPASALWDAATDKPTVTLIGFVDGDFELTARGGKFPFRVLPENERIVVYGTDWVRPRYGQELTLTGKLQQPTNSGDFDYVSYLAKDGIYAQMYFPQYGVPEQPLALPLSVRAKRLLISVRDAVGGALTRAVPQPAAGYLNGILLGVKADIGSELKSAFSRTGTSHIMAISGYNITIVASVLMAVLASLGRRRSFWCTVAGIVIFVVMVGASASVVRAGIMGVLGLMARFLGRQANAGTAILLSGAVMAAHNPLVVRWDVGFQLSFLAVIGIVYLEPLIRAPLKRLMYEPLAGMAATTLAAQIMVLPLILYDFGTLAVYTLPVNLLVLPLVPLAMALGFVTAITGLIIPFLGALVGQIAWLVAAIQLALIRFAADLPYASVEVGIGTPLLIAAYVGLAAWLISVYRGRTESEVMHGGDAEAIRSGL
jgi:competence protein ComEC